MEINYRQIKLNYKIVKCILHSWILSYIDQGESRNILTVSKMKIHTILCFI